MSRTPIRARLSALAQSAVTVLFAWMAAGIGINALDIAGPLKRSTEILWATVFFAALAAIGYGAYRMALRDAERRAKERAGAAATINPTSRPSI